MKISIITATYNSGATLRDTINSILSQNYSHWQHVIVDGGSKDNTIDIIREYEPAYKGRLKWISENDKGIYDAMNKGIAMADGDIIGILNSDDFFTSNNILSLIVSNIKDVDCVYGDVHYVEGEDLSNCKRYYSSKGFKNWQMRLGFMPAHPSFYCKSYIYKKCGNFDTTMKSAADFDMLLRILVKEKYHARYIPADFVTMRIGGISTSGIKSYLLTMDETLKSLRKNNIHSNYFLMFLKCAYKYIQLKFLI